MAKTVNILDVSGAIGSQEMASVPAALRTSGFRNDGWRGVIAGGLLWWAGVVQRECLHVPHLSVSGWWARALSATQAARACRRQSAGPGGSCLSGAENGGCPAANQSASRFLVVKQNYLKQLQTSTPSQESFAARRAQNTVEIPTRKSPGW